MAPSMSSSREKEVITAFNEDALQPVLRLTDHYSPPTCTWKPSKIMESHKKATLSKSLVIAAAALSPLTSQAQLFIDRSGARDILFKDEMTKTDAFRLHFDSKDKSLSASHFFYANDK